MRCSTIVTRVDFSQTYHGAQSKTDSLLQNSLIMKSFGLLLE